MANNNLSALPRVPSGGESSSDDEANLYVYRPDLDDKKQALKVKQVAVLPKVEASVEYESDYTYYYSEPKYEPVIGQNKNGTVYICGQGSRMGVWRCGFCQNSMCGEKKDIERRHERWNNRLIQMPRIATYKVSIETLKYGRIIAAMCYRCYNDGQSAMFNNVDIYVTCRKLC